MLDRQASKALDEWCHAVHDLATAIDARETAERLHADALAARHPFKSRIGRTYSRLVSAIVREDAAVEAEAAARLRFGRTGALRDHALDDEPLAPRPAADVWARHG